MKDPIIETVSDPVAEARRYVENAQTILKEHGNLDYETQLYQDRKYVRMAGNTLWNGCLIALDTVLGVRKGKGRPSIDKYKEAAKNRDKKLLAFVVDGYNTLHLCMGYDGNKSKKVCDAGFEYANAIIDHCEKLCPAPAYA